MFFERVDRCSRCQRWLYQVTVAELVAGPGDDGPSLSASVRKRGLALAQRLLHPLALGDVVKAIDRSGDLSLFILQRTNIDDDGDP